MRIIICEDNKRILKNKKIVEKELNVKLFFKAKEILIGGEAHEEYLAEKVIEAINFGFPIEVALSIVKDENIFEIIKIKDYTHRKDLETIRARIIGKQGRTLRTLNQLTDCNFEIKGNLVGIIGSAEHIKNSQDAVISLIQGSKQANVYNYLEKHPHEQIIDFGIKENKKPSLEDEKLDWEKELTNLNEKPKKRLIRKKVSSLKKEVSVKTVSKKNSKKPLKKAKE